MAKALGIDEKTVNVAAMHLRKAGWITKAGRGTAGAEMKPSDAANLLIALLASEQLKDAPEKVRLYRQATLTHHTTELPPYSGIERHGSGQSFGEVLDLFLANIVNEGDPTNEESGLPFTNYQLTLSQRHYHAELWLDDGSDTWTLQYQRNHPALDGVDRTRRIEVARSLFDDMGDLEVEARVTNRTLDAIGDLLGDWDDKDET